MSEFSSETSIKSHIEERGKSVTLSSAPGGRKRLFPQLSSNPVSSAKSGFLGSRKTVQNHVGDAWHSPKTFSSLERSHDAKTRWFSRHPNVPFARAYTESTV
ncbi:hypothetical protein AAC387_Pa08g1008 [Persea americana]